MCFSKPQKPKPLPTPAPRKEPELAIADKRKNVKDRTATAANKGVKGLTIPLSVNLPNASSSPLNIPR